MSNLRRLCKVSVALALALWLVSGARADQIAFSGTEGNKGRGSFQGTLAYTDVDAHHAILTLVLQNTSPEAHGGFLTAFAFNNPGNKIQTVELVPILVPIGEGAGANVSPRVGVGFDVLGGNKHFDNGINGSPFGRFDIGLGIGKGFQGGGKPSNGIAVGTSEKFWLWLNGNGLDGLNAESFAQALSDPPKKCDQGVPFEARFRGFSDPGGGDHVPGFEVHNTPEPSTLILGGMALMGLIGFGYFRRGEE
ncbi:MAG: PEP-CTERM sorting domain-containing protein [Planctomycetes bacterium]|nr:PEP-CTERM sorting domain-containing protein [Planctomycetota bacterium]